MNFTVKNPEIAEVLDMRTGDYYATSALIGREYDEVIQLRMAAQESIAARKPRYRCAICGVPVFLCCLKARRRFFFKHLHDERNCPSITKGALTQGDIDARKYNGAKESDLHKSMKDWIARSLKADPRFHDIQVEETWKGALNGELRRPDVRAFYGEVPVVFEIQLSTAHLSIIAGRRQFYLSEGGLLLWVFAQFEATSRPLMQDDVFFNNNRNAFIVDATTLVASEQGGVFRLDCIWAEPQLNGGLAPLQRRQVGFDELTLNMRKQQVYYFDFYGQRAEMLHRQDTDPDLLREAFFAFWPDEHFDIAEEPEWPALAERLQRAGIRVPQYPDGTLIYCLSAAKRGYGRARGPLRQPQTLNDIAHRLYQSHKPHLRIFLHAIEVYGHGALFKRQDSSGKWAAKARVIDEARRNETPAYLPDQRQYRFIKFLFPEVFAMPTQAQRDVA